MNVINAKNGLFMFPTIENHLILNPTFREKIKFI